MVLLLHKKFLKILMIYIMSHLTYQIWQLWPCDLLMYPVKLNLSNVNPSRTLYLHGWNNSRHSNDSLSLPSIADNSGGGQEFPRTIFPFSLTNLTLHLWAIWFGWHWPHSQFHPVMYLLKLISIFWVLCVFLGLSISHIHLATELFRNGSMTQGRPIKGKSTT